MHQLWDTHEWESATEEQVIAALFNPPPFLNPFDMAAIKQHHPQARGKYQNLFYGGQIPGYVKRVNRRLDCFLFLLFLVTKILL